MEHPLGLVEQANDAYHRGPGISKSHLDVIASASPKHYWAKYVDPNRERADPTPAMVLGSAIHSAILEPDLFPNEYACAPQVDRRTKAGKEEYAAFELANASKIVLADADYQTCLAVRDAVHCHPVAAGLLTGGKAEQSFYAIDAETGELVKCRTDYLYDSGEMIIDLKSTEDASPTGFGKSAANFRYDLQPPWYFDVLDAAFGEHPKHWVFLAVEKKPPYAVGIYFAKPDDIERARAAARRDFLRIIEAKRENAWPDYGIEALPLELPAWVRR